MARVRGLSTYGTVCSAAPSDTSISVWPYELTGNGACQRFCPTRRYSALMDPRAFRYRRVGRLLGRVWAALVILASSSWLGLEVRRTIPGWMGVMAQAAVVAAERRSRAWRVAVVRVQMGR